MLAQHGVSANPANFELYREVLLEVLGANMQQRQPEAEDQARWVFYYHHRSAHWLASSELANIRWLCVNLDFIYYQESGA